MSDTPNPLQSLPWLTLLAVGVTLVGWIVIGTYRFAQLEELQQSMQRENGRRIDQIINEMRTRTDDRYHASTARARNNQVDERFNIVRRDIERIDAKFKNYPPQWLLDDFREMRGEFTRRLDQQEKWLDTIWPRLSAVEDAQGIPRARSNSRDMQ